MTGKGYLGRSVTEQARPVAAARPQSLLVDVFLLILAAIASTLR